MVRGGVSLPSGGTERGEFQHTPHAVRARPRTVGTCDGTIPRSVRVHEPSIVDRAWRVSRQISRICHLPTVTGADTLPPSVTW